MICPRCHGAGRVDSVHEQTGIPAEVAHMVAPVYIPSRRCGECMGAGIVNLPEAPQTAAEQSGAISTHAGSERPANIDPSS